MLISHFTSYISLAMHVQNIWGVSPLSLSHLLLIVSLGVCVCDVDDGMDWCLYVLMSGCICAFVAVVGRRFPLTPLILHTVGSSNNDNARMIHTEKVRQRDGMNEKKKHNNTWIWGACWHLQHSLIFLLLLPFIHCCCCCCWWLV